MTKKSLYPENIVRRILIFTLTICMMLTTVLIYFSHNITKERSFKVINDMSFKNSQIYAETIGDWIHERMNAMQIYADTPIVKSMDWNKIEPYLKKEIKDSKIYNCLFIADDLGNFVTTDGDHTNIYDRKYFQAAMSGKSSISNLLISKLTKELICTIAVPIRNDNGKIVGVMGGIMNLEHIHNLTKKFKVDHPDSYSYILDKNGLTISHPNKNFVMNKNIIKSIEFVDPKPYNIDQVLNNDMGYIEYNFEGTMAYGYYYSIPNTDGWKLFIKVPKEYISKSIQENTNKLLSIGILGTMIIGIISLVIGQVIAEPMLKLKKDMKESKRLLEERIKYDQLRTEFFSNISHELKTPLNIIFSTTQLLNLSIKDPENIHVEKLNKYVHTMKQNCNRLLRLINNLIDITKIDSGFMQLNLQNKNIVDIIEDITLSTVEYVKSKGRTIIFDTEVEEKVMAFDLDKIERIILNLISNAIKFTKPGDKIEVSIYDKEDKVFIVVKDTGIGIPEDKQNLIFERFRQVDGSLKRKTEGSGIGLSLVKSLVTMHEGNISVKRECGKGTEFVIKLPVKLVSEADYITKDSSFLEKDRVEKINIEFSDIYS
ncbi:GHKL domain-containing protein [Crassaminicella thermophila]|uniref:histidine kinase n=1 Tax=Crassaminicella thermophila TaxID=2599308 RepID=A0A5C0SB90_CRATE|nr:sensor histidine kinase [Crassaminicella thermophila]QEK11360.1 GHKL domain-containing protein [Crassaminicella thermophila]